LRDGASLGGRKREPAALEDDRSFEEVAAERRPERQAG
jgi:hypothetical protein